MTESVTAYNILYALANDGALQRRVRSLLRWEGDELLLTKSFLEFIDRGIRKLVELTVRAEGAGRASAGYRWPSTGEGLHREAAARPPSSSRSKERQYRAYCHRHRHCWQLRPQQQACACRPGS